MWVGKRDRITWRKRFFFVYFGFLPQSFSNYKRQDLFLLLTEELWENWVVPNILLQIQVKKQLRKVFLLVNLFLCKAIFFYCMPYSQNDKTEFLFIIISLLILKYSFLPLMPQVTPPAMTRICILLLARDLW